MGTAVQLNRQIYRLVFVRYVVDRGEDRQPAARDRRTP